MRGRLHQSIRLLLCQFQLGSRRNTHALETPSSCSAIAHKEFDWWNHLDTISHETNQETRRAERGLRRRCFWCRTSKNYNQQTPNSQSLKSPRVGEILNHELI
jgi:hypothetical protein